MGTVLTTRRRRAVWIVFLVLAYGAVAMGFSRQITLRFTGQADYPAPHALVIHVWSFFGWLTLLTLQVALIETRRVAWHKLLGIGALVLAPVMVWSAIAAESYSQRFYALQYPDGVRFFPIPVASMTCFALAVIAALILRGKPDWHRRCIYLATSAVLVAAFFRWWGDTLYAALPGGILAEWVANYVGVFMLMALGVLHDLITRKRVHGAFKIGVPAFLALQLTAVSIGQSDWWPLVGRSLLGIP